MKVAGAFLQNTSNSDQELLNGALSPATSTSSTSCNAPSSMAEVVRRDLAVSALHTSIDRQLLTISNERLRLRSTGSKRCTVSSLRIAVQGSPLFDHSAMP